MAQRGSFPKPVALGQLFIVFRLLVANVVIFIITHSEVVGRSIGTD